jgi:hypothetical protein
MSKKDHDYGDAPVQEKYKEQMIAIITTVNKFFNGDAPVGKRKIAVVLMTFPFGDGPGRCNYMSNGVSREDMVVLFKEQAARFEGQFSAQEGKG